jgi:glucose/arabinose dehydrogenase
LTQPARGGLSAAVVINLALVVGGLVLIAALAVGRLLPGETAAPGEAISLSITLEPVARGFDGPVFLTGAGDGSGDRYVVEQRGRVLRLDAGDIVDPDPLLDISDRVLHHHERGLLGLAVHPAFARNGRFFVAYSRRDDGATSISEFTLPRVTDAGSAAPSGEPRASAAPEPTDPPRPVEATERPLLVIAQPWTTHKGGMLAFDHDGMLLFGSGDGGSGDDPQGHGLDRRSLLGKLLRIDVDSGWPYAIPADNGFASDRGARGELHAIGLRNPWRFSIDRASGDIYIGDVGQSSWEEVDVLTRGSRETSFGWSDMEGPVCMGDRVCDPAAHILPAQSYQHGDGDVGHCAIVGGYAYRGSRGSLPMGSYLYGDYCSGTIWAAPAGDLVAAVASASVVGRLDPVFGQLVSFGEDDAGEIYAISSSGHILHVTDSADPG